MNKKIFFLPALILLLSGCGLVQFGGGNKAQQQATPAGFYKTSDQGDNWNASMDVYSVGGQNLTFAGSNITAMVLDPNDPDTLYLGTETRGMLYSYNKGEAWFSSAPASGVINAIALDNNNKCTVYVAIHNRVFKSTDCNRSWKEIHLSSIKGEFFTSLKVDPFDSRVLYLGTSRGTLLKSTDAGFSWQAINFFSDRIAKIIINPNDGAKVYVATAAQGIFYSADSGASWESLLDRVAQTAREDISGEDRPLRHFPGSNILLSLAFDHSQQNGLIYSNNYGIFRLLDSGQWQEIFILNKPHEESVTAIYVNPVNGQEIYFATTGAFYQSSNGGQDWTVKPLISAGLPRYLIVSPSNGQEIYLGFYLPR